LQVKCKNCSVDMPEGEKCVFSVSKKTIGGEEYTFCCEFCAEEYERAVKKTR